MAAYLSSYPGTLVLPTGKLIANGERVELSDQAVKNAGVSSWISQGYLKEVKSEKPKREQKASEQGR